MPPPKKKRGAPPGKRGQARQFLIDNFTVNEQTVICLSGHVLFLYFESDKSILKTLRAIERQFGFEPKYGQVDSVVRRASCLIENFSRQTNRDSLVKLCDEVFVVRYNPAQIPAVLTPVQPSSPPLPTVQSTLPALPTVQPTLPALPTVSSTPEASAPPILQCYTDPGPLSSHSPPRLAWLRSDQVTPRKQALKRRLSHLSQELSAKLKQHRIEKTSLKENIKSRPYKFKQQNQTILRKSNTIRQLKTALRDQPSRQQVKQLENENAQLKKKLALSKAKSSDKAALCERNFRRELSSKDNLIQTLQNEILTLQEQVEQLQCPEETTSKKGKQYTSDIRGLVYDMLMCHVPTRFVPLLLQKFGEHAQVQFSNVPHRTTVEQMARELGVISELQAAETAVQTKDLTLAFDATTQEGVHVNAIHITTEKECQVLAIDQLAGGTADDYETHITQSVDHVAKLYSDYHQEDYAEVRNKIINNISNTMSDWAAVNHATVTKVSALWQKTLNELNCQCHLHPLDTMASSCRTSLKGLETSKGKLFGKDCVAANIVLQLNKLRYKDGKGDPKGFTIFLDDHNLPRGLLPRYRGNRLHILFHTCGVLIHHYPVLRQFLSTGLVSCGGLRDGLFHDFTSETGVLELCALGLLGKLLTGPWMTKFYTGPDSGIDYLDGIEVVRNVQQALAQSAVRPLSLLDCHTDFFGNNISSDPVFASIVAFCPRTEEMRDMLTLCLDSCISVIDRQYKRQFETVQTEALRAQVQTARLHNIDSEELMGICLVQLRIRPPMQRSATSPQFCGHQKTRPRSTFMLRPKNRRRR